MCYNNMVVETAIYGVSSVDIDYNLGGIEFLVPDMFFDLNDLKRKPGPSSQYATHIFTYETIFKGLVGQDSVLIQAPTYWELPGWYCNPVQADYEVQYEYFTKGIGEWVDQPGQRGKCLCLCIGQSRFGFYKR